MPRTIMILLIAIAALLGGCVTQQERMELIRAQYPELDQASVQQLVEGRIRVGMTEEMVITAKGKPRFNYNENGAVVWEYVRYKGGEVSGMYIVDNSTKVYFQNKRVINIVEWP
jgi:hypothetical protein